jgi:hypothetical protein
MAPTIDVGIILETVRRKIWQKMSSQLQKGIWPLTPLSLQQHGGEVEDWIYSRVHHK